MKKVFTKITILAIILVILAGGFWFYKNFVGEKSFPSTKDILIKNYPMLKNEAYAGHLLKQYWDSQTLNEMTGEMLSFNEKEDVFYCKGVEIETIKYLSFTPGGNSMGGWYTDYIVGCENTYWVFRKMGPGNIGPMFGPFSKQKKN